MQNNPPRAGGFEPWLWVFPKWPLARAAHPGMLQAAYDRGGALRRHGWTVHANGASAPPPSPAKIALGATPLGGYSSPALLRCTCQLPAPWRAAGGEGGVIVAPPARDWRWGLYAHESCPGPTKCSPERRTPIPAQSLVKTKGMQRNPL